MPEPLASPTSDTELQFATAEPADFNTTSAPVGQQCALCQQPISDVYYSLGDRVICTSCRDQIAAVPKGTKLGRIARAFFMGLGAGLLGTTIWFLIRRFTGFEIGLVAIFVGLMVGKAVHKGTQNQGGIGYQIMAVLLTYCCISANYMPDVFEGMLNAVEKAKVEKAAKVAEPAPVQQAGPMNAAEGANAEAGQNGEAKFNFGQAVFAVFVLFAVVFAVSLSVPFLAGAENLIGLLIIGFALWEAWKFSARKPIPITGPYHFGALPAV